MAELDTSPIDWIVTGFDNFFEILNPLMNSFLSWFVVGIILGFVVLLFFLVFKLASAGSQY